MCASPEVTHSFKQTPTLWHYIFSDARKSIVCLQESSPFCWKVTRKNLQAVCKQAQTQWGMQGIHPPTRPKEVLTRHLISLKIIAKNIFVLHTKN